VIANAKANTSVKKKKVSLFLTTSQKITTTREIEAETIPERVTDSINLTCHVFSIFNLPKVHSKRGYNKNPNPVKEANERIINRR